MLVSCWSAKGGSGTTVVSVALALLLARSSPSGAVLVDLAGDVPAVLGLAGGGAPGVLDWLAAGPSTPADALARLEVPAGPGLAVVPRGGPSGVGGARVAAPAPAGPPHPPVAVGAGPVPEPNRVGDPAGAPTGDWPPGAPWCDDGSYGEAAGSYGADAGAYGADARGAGRSLGDGWGDAAPWSGAAAAGGIERGDLLAGLLAADARPVVADCGTAVGDSADAAALTLAASASVSLLVLRPCFLALRRAAAAPLRPSGVVLVTEPGRALGRRDVEEVLGCPVRAEVAWDPTVARAVDAGLLAVRLPRSLARGLRGAA